MGEADGGGLVVGVIGNAAGLVADLMVLGSVGFLFLDEAAEVGALNGVEDGLFLINIGRTPVPGRRGLEGVFGFALLENPAGVVLFTLLVDHKH